MQVIFILSLVLFGYVSGLATVLIVQSTADFIKEHRARKDEKEKQAVEKETAAFKGLIDCQYRTMVEQVEELTLRLKVEEEAHKYWHSRWAELNSHILGDEFNNTNTQGDNE